MQPEHAAAVREWLDLVRLDLLAADRLLSTDMPLIEPAVFHLQQAAEKALKAFLVWRDRPFPLTHNLLALINLCAQLDDGFHRLEHAALTLTPYAVEHRYPDRPPQPTHEDALEADALARQIVAFVLDRLPPELH